MRTKKKIVVFLSDEVLKALNDKAKSEDQSRSNTASQIIKKSLSDAKA